MQLLTKEELRHQLVTERNINKHLRHKLKQFEWVSVDDRLPDRGDYVIASTKRHGVKVGCYVSYKKPTIWNGQQEHQITHWMPLPPTP